MQNRAYGCLIGIAIGDAMGMPASFMSPWQIKKTYGRIEGFMKPEKEQIAHGCLEKGEVTDDTEETLILSAVMIENKGYNEADFVAKMRKWAVDNNMLASTVIGPSTRAFLQAIIQGGDYTEIAKKGDTNGAAMRVAPVGIFHHGNFDAAVQDAILSAKPSHSSKPGIASACAVAAAIALSVEGGHTPEEIISAAYAAAKTGEAVGADLASPSVAARIALAKQVVEENSGKSLEEISIRLYDLIGAGMKSYESIPLSLGIFYAAKGDFNTGLIAAINIGDDADTNGAITGGLCGAYTGMENMNPLWIEEIQRFNHIDFSSIAKKLLAQ